MAEMFQEHHEFLDARERTNQAIRLDADQGVIGGLMAEQNQAALKLSRAEYGGDARGRDQSAANPGGGTIDRKDNHSGS